MTGHLGTAVILGAVLVAAPCAPAAPPPPGVVLSWHGRESLERFGSAVAGAGDVDGDGRDDFAVGAYQAHTAGGEASGLVLVFSGADGTVIGPVERAGTFGGFGSAVASLGDLERDGVPDFVVGAPYDATAGEEAGGAFVFRGSDGALLAAFHGEAPGILLGSAVAGAGDVTPVLFVNGSTGAGPMRKVVAGIHDPITIWMEAPPALAGGPARFAPSLVLSRPGGAGRAMTLFLQGILEDPGSAQGRGALTNGVTLWVK